VGNRPPFRGHRGHAIYGHGNETIGEDHCTEIRGFAFEGGLREKLCTYEVRRPRGYDEPFATSPRKSIVVGWAALKRISSIAK
jgi:hypothetical protein